MVYEQLGLKIDCKREREREACCPMGLLVIIFTNFIGQNFSTYLNRTIIIQMQFLPLAFFHFFFFFFFFYFFMVLSNDEKIEMLWTAVNFFPIN